MGESVSRISGLFKDRGGRDPHPSFASESPAPTPSDSAAQLAAIVESSDDAIFSNDMRGIITSWNVGAERVFGYTAEEAVGRPITILFPPDRLDEEARIMERLRRGEHLEHYETLRLRKDGALINVSVTISPIRSASGEIVGVSQIARDITERKRTELRLRRHLEELRALNAVTRTINERVDVEAILRGALEQIAALTGVESAECHLCNSADLLELTADYHLPAPFLTASREHPLPLNEGIPGQAVSRREPVMVSDIQTEPSFVRRSLAIQAGFRSLLCVPMLGREGISGTFTLYSREPREFSEEQQTLLMIVGRELAAAVERARLYEQERGRTRELDRSNTLITSFSRVATRLSAVSNPQAVMESLGSELAWLDVRCAVALLDEKQQTLEIQYTSPESAALTAAETLTGVRWQGFRLTPEHFPLYAELVKRQRPVFVQDVLPIALALLPEIARPVAERALALTGISARTHAFFLPLVIEGRTLGILVLWGGNLREADMAAASVFANQVAIALENARLFKEVERLAITDELTGLYNRRHLLELSEREFNMARRYQHPISIIFLDLDDFKQINDLYGHAAGDQALRAVAKRARACIRSVDVLARYGGEEFTILLPETDNSTALEVGERLRREIAASTIETEQGAISLTASVGVATTHAPPSDLAYLIDQADRAMYEAKQGGGNRVVVKTV